MYISIRITPEYTDRKEDFEDVNIMRTFIRTMLIDLERYNFNSPIEKYIVAQEELNKHGEKTHLHYHINFELEDEDVKKDTIQKFIRSNYGFKGNNQYALSYHRDVEDADRFYRYCCKEKMFIQKGFKDNEISQMTLLAQDERDRQTKANCKTREDLKAKSQFRDKLFKHLQDTNVDGNKNIYIAIIAYYQNNNKTPPFKKLDDLVVDYSLVAGKITASQYYELHH